MRLISRGESLCFLQRVSPGFPMQKALSRQGPVWGVSGLCCWTFTALGDMPRGKSFWKLFAVGFAS